MSKTFNVECKVNKGNFGRHEFKEGKQYAVKEIDQTYIIEDEFGEEHRYNLYSNNALEEFKHFFKRV